MRHKVRNRRPNTWNTRIQITVRIDGEPLDLGYRGNDWITVNDGDTIDVDIDTTTVRNLIAKLP